MVMGVRAGVLERADAQNLDAAAVRFAAALAAPGGALSQEELAQIQVRIATIERANRAAADLARGVAGGAGAGGGDPLAAQGVDAAVNAVRESLRRLTEVQERARASCEAYQRDQEEALRTPLFSGARLGRMLDIGLDYAARLVREDNMQGEGV